MPAVSARLNANAADLMERIPKEGPIRAQKHRAFLRDIIKALDRRITIDGADIQETKEGVHIRIRAQEPEEDPWTTTLSGGALSIVPATIQSRVPTIGGVRLDNEPPPQMAITMGTAQYLYARCDLDYILENIEGEDRVVAVTLAQGDVTMLLSTQTVDMLDDPATGIFHLHIATIGAGGTIQQIYSHSPSIHFTVNTLPEDMVITFV